jgi:hypothetical protein
MRPLMAAPGPSRTGASWEATGLGARNLSWRGKTAAEDEGWRSMGQPHTSCRWDASLPDATTVSPAPPASRSPGGRGRRQPHGRAVWPRRCHSPPPCRQHHLPTAAREGAGGASRTVVPFGRVVVPGPPTRPAPTTRPNESLRRGTRLAASTTSTWLVHRAGSAGNDAPKRHECAAGAARALSGCGWQVVLPTLLVASGNDAAKRHECAAGAARALSGCGWQRVLSVRWWRQETTHPKGPSVRLAPPAPSRAAAGSRSCRCGGGVRKRRTPKARVCGWLRPRPLGLRLAAGAPGVVGVCFRSLPQVTSAQPRGLPRCTSARGTRRCRMVRGVVLCARVCSAGTRRCLVLPSHRQECTCVQRRARTQFDTHVNEGPPWSVWPGASSRMVHKARMRDCQERRGG